MKEGYKHITHDALKPFISETCKILILGSLPSIESRKARFYYANKTNRFFKALAGVLKEKEPISLSERKAFLAEHGIALYDVIESCDIIASKDSSIKNVKIARIGDLIKGTQIKKVFVTGKKAYELYLRYINTDCIYLPSPSAANASFSLNKLIECYKVLLPYLD